MIGRGYGVFRVDVFFIWFGEVVIWTCLIVKIYFLEYGR